MKSLLTISKRIFKSNLLVVKRCIIIFSLALLIRICFSIPVFIYPERSFGFGSDSYCYDNLAKRIIEYQGFSIYPESNYIPEPARTPGYPFLLSTIYKLFGQKPTAVIIFQSILDSITAVLIFITLASVLSPVAGFISGLIYAINLHQALYTTQILTEITFTFTLFLSIFLLLRFYRNKNYYLLLSAVLVGIAALIRPIALYFPIFVCIWLLIMLKDKLKLAGKSVGLFILGFMIVITPWGIRNYKHFGKFFISIIDDINIAHFNAAPVVAQVEGISESKAREKIFELIKDNYGVSNEEITLFGDDPRISGLMRRVGLEIIRRHPGIYVREHLLGFSRVFVHSELAYWSMLFYGYSREKLKSMEPISKDVMRYILTGKIKSAFNLAYKERLGVMPIPLIFLYSLIFVFELFIYVLSFWGGVYLFKNNRPMFLLFILTIFYFAFIPGPVGNARFRVPIESFISILAGYGIFHKIKPQNDRKMSISENQNIR